MPIGLLWILNLIFSNSLINKMIDTALSLSLVSPFIVHWVGLGMLTIDLVWTDWLSVIFWAMYMVYGVGEIFMAMIFSPPIYEYLENNEFRKETTTSSEEIRQTKVEEEEGDQAKQTDSDDFSFFF